MFMVQLELSQENIEMIKHKASLYIEIYLGNMLYPDAPLKIVINGGEIYQIPIKSASDVTNSTLGYLYMDARTMEIERDISSSIEDIDKAVEEIMKG